MAAINDGPFIYREDGNTFAVNKAGLFNASVLQSEASDPRIVDFLCRNVQAVSGIAESGEHSLPSQFRDSQYVRVQTANYLRALTDAGIVEFVPGTPGRKSRMVSGGSHSIGEVDLGPGYWLHTDLAIPFAEQKEGRISPNERKPLVEFVKRALSNAGVKSAKREGPRSAAKLFSAGVSEKLQKMLKAADASLIEAGESFDDRREALANFLKSVKGGQK
ncbi:hypothetical protein [Pseudomonas sp. PS02290]|uniref:hypothetical protein n=1 Tax=Pseudomonas sp. PS02290 TaxID=2991430 RepID=UPI00249BB4A0|nr:hypothetical protein [Pseudomonas sp. PS02290]